MEREQRAAYEELLHGQGIDPRQIVEGAIEFVATMAVEEMAESGALLDIDTAYDAVVEGIRSSAERHLT